MREPTLFIRRMLTLFVPFLVALILISRYVGELQAQKEIDNLVASVSTGVEMSRSVIESELNSATRDLMLMAEQPQLHEALDLISTDTLIALYHNFKAISENRGTFDQLRWIDEDGQEQFRIELGERGAYSVPLAHLQRKEDRYYFVETMALKPGEVYLSPMDLNMEWGSLEQPYKPMVRLSTPLFSSTGDARGILIINYLAQILLDRLDNQNLPGSAKIELLNSNGYWLLSQTEQRSFGFMFDDPTAFSSVYPQVWSVISASGRGVFDSEQGYYIYDQVDPQQVAKKALENSWVDQSGRVSAASHERWIILGEIPIATLAAIRQDAQGRMLSLQLLLAFLGLVASAAYARVDLMHDRSARKNIRLSERNSLLTALGEGVFGLDDTGLCTFVNDRACEILGYQESELLGRNIIELLQPEGQNTSLVSENSQQPAGQQESLFRVKSGAWVDVSLNRTQVSDQNGKPMGEVVAFSNISGRKHTERELKKVLDLLDHEREFFKSLVETVPVLVWVKDPEGVYLACNREFELFYGAQEADIVGKSDYDFVDAEQAKFFREHDLHAMNMGRSVVNEEWIKYASDGHDALIETTKTPMYGKAGDLIGVIGVGHDITERYRTNQTLQLHSRVIEQVQDRVMIIDMDRKIIFANSAMTEHFGFHEGELTGQPVDVLYSLHADPNVLTHLMLTVKEQGEWTGEVEVLNRKGERKFDWVRASLIRDEDDQPVAVVGVSSDITERKQYQEQMHYLAHHDPLTGLPNRLLLADRLEQAMLESDRRDKELALVFIDLDGFKSVNDQFGHESGDKLLIQLAKRMKSVLREEDTLARVGGDEFVAILRDITSHESLDMVLERLLYQTAQEVNVVGGVAKVSASIGVTFYPQAQGLSADQLLNQADSAMYEAKMSGKNQVYCFSQRPAANG